MYTGPFDPTCGLCSQTLTRVDDDVLGQIPHVDERLVAHVALVWADVVVVADMVGELTGLDEPVPGDTNS